MTNQEINKAISEKLMGWKQTGICNFGGGVVFNYDIYAIRGFKPTENIQDAWLVVDKIIEKSKEGWLNKFIDALYKIYKTETDESGLYYLFTDKKAPRTICLAALEAIKND